MTHDPGLKGVPRPSDLSQSAEERRAMQALSLRRSLGHGLKIDQRGRVTIDLPSGGPLVADGRGLQLRTDIDVDKGVLLNPAVPENEGFGLDERSFHDDIENEIARLAAKSPIDAGDWLVLEDVADRLRKKKGLVSDLPGSELLKSIGSGAVEIDLGSLPNSTSKNIAHGLTIDYSKKVVMTGSARVGASLTAIPLPFMALDPMFVIALTMDDLNLVVTTSFDASDMTGLVFLGHS